MRTSSGVRGTHWPTFGNLYCKTKQRKGKKINENKKKKKKKNVNVTNKTKEMTTMMVSVILTFHLTTLNSMETEIKAKDAEK